MEAAAEQRDVGADHRVEAGAGRSLQGRNGKSGGTATRTLGSVAELGKVGAVDAAFLYLQLHAAHFEALERVSKRVEIANNLLNHIEEFEKGARALRGAVSELQRAEAALPGEPLATDEEARSVSVSLGELEYIEAYVTSAGNIISKAFDARVKLNKIIQGVGRCDCTEQRDPRFHTEGSRRPPRFSIYVLIRSPVATFELSLLMLATTPGASKPGRTRNGAMRKTFSIPRICL